MCVCMCLFSRLKNQRQWHSQCRIWQSQRKDWRNPSTPNEVSQNGVSPNEVLPNEVSPNEVLPKRKEN